MPLLLALRLGWTPEPTSSHRSPPREATVLGRAVLAVSLSVPFVRLHDQLALHRHQSRMKKPLLPVLPTWGTLVAVLRPKFGLNEHAKRVLPRRLLPVVLPFPSPFIGTVVHAVLEGGRLPLLPFSSLLRLARRPFGFVYRQFPFEEKSVVSRPATVMVARLLGATAVATRRVVHGVLVAFATLVIGSVHGLTSTVDTAVAFTPSLTRTSAGPPSLPPYIHNVSRLLSSLPPSSAPRFLLCPRVRQRQLWQLCGPVHA